MRSRSLQVHFTSAATLALLLLGGCAPGDPTAALDELPAEAAASLGEVPDRLLLATAVRPPDLPPQPAGLPLPMCRDEGSLTYSDVRIQMPITICSHDIGTVSRESVLFPTDSARTTYKLTDPEIFAGFENGVLWQPPLVCTTSQGPWPAVHSENRMCHGQCLPVHNLFVVGVPQPVVFVWNGDFDDHPSGFELVGEPVVTSRTIFICNPGGGGDGGGPIP